MLHVCSLLAPNIANPLDVFKAESAKSAYVAKTLHNIFHSKGAWPFLQLARQWLSIESYAGGL